MSKVKVADNEHFSATELQFSDGSAIEALIDWKKSCSLRLDCGGSCVLAAGHLCPCECGGDEPGQPGTCWA